MKILHDHTFLYIALTIGVGNILVAPFFKSQFLWKFMLFLKKKHDFLSNYIFLLNQLNKVCTFYAIAPFNTLWTQMVRGRAQFPLFSKIMTSKKVTLFLKNNTLKKKCHLFNKSNKQILHILHDHTLLQIPYVIGKRKKHITPIF